MRGLFIIALVILPQGRRDRGARLALISSPRSANTWLRRLLASTFELEELAVFTPDELAWERLPERCVVQIHWPRSRPLLGLLRRHGFQVCVLMRHPLDVLISILHFAAHEPQTARWIGGAHGDERAIVGFEPCSTEFIRYATSARARSLVAVSQQWWNRHAVARVRFEELVADPAGELERIVAGSRMRPVLAIDRAIETLEFSRLQGETPKEHYWQGRPGLWRRLVPPEYASALADPYRRQATRYGYDIEPDPDLSTAEARAEWHRLTG